MNDKSFKDRETTIDEILSLFFKSLYMWTAGYVFPRLISYSHLFFLLLLVRCFILYIFCVLRSALHFKSIYNTISRLPLFSTTVCFKFINTIAMCSLVITWPT
jgi:hypothetical protein